QQHADRRLRPAAPRRPGFLRRGDGRQRPDREQGEGGVVLLILPRLRGRVASVSEPGGGILNFGVTPPAALTCRILPFQGRDKKAQNPNSRFAVPLNNFARSPASGNQRDTSAASGP